MWQSHDHARIWCKTATSLLIPQWRIFERNLFYKIDAEASYLPYSSVKICLPLSCQLGNQIHTLYSKHELYKLWGRGRTPSVGVTSFQRQHLHVESWSSKNKADTPAHSGQQVLCCFPAESTLHTVCIFNIRTADWGWDSRPLQRKKPFRQLCSLCFTSCNEHIIIRQAREQGCPAVL